MVTHRMFAKVTPGQCGQCAVCKTRPAEEEGGLCRACGYAKSYDPREVATRQTAQALRLITDLNRVVRWPWPTLHAMTGPLPLGHIAYVAANTSVGKTTFVLDLVRRWCEAGVGVMVLPTETTAEEFRMSLACVMLGIEHGDLFDLTDRAELDDVEAIATLATLRELNVSMLNDPTWVSRLHVADREGVSVDGLDAEFSRAKAAGCKVVVIDHIDEVSNEPDPYTRRVATGIDAIKAVNDGLLVLAKHHQMAVVATSQLNALIDGDGTNPLSRYTQPQLKHVKYNTLKTTKATQILGIFRPLKPGTTRHDFTAVRNATLEPREVLDQGVMGIAALKLRKRGRNEGNITELIYTGGRLRCLTTGEQEARVMMKTISEPLSHNSPVWAKQIKGGG